MYSMLMNYYSTPITRPTHTIHWCLYKYAEQIAKTPGCHSVLVLVVLVASSQQQGGAWRRVIEESKEAEFSYLATYSSSVINKLAYGTYELLFNAVCCHPCMGSYNDR
jgi:hypothetical protein